MMLIVDKRSCGFVFSCLWEILHGAEVEHVVPQSGNGRSSIPSRIVVKNFKALI